MEYYINKSMVTGDWKVYAQNGSEITLATFKTQKEAEKYIKIRELDGVEINELTEKN